jgi:hypothetical protein
MSLTNETVSATYAGNGIQTVFPIPFGVIQNDSNEVKVWRRDDTVPTAITETLLTEGVHYNLTGAAPPAIPFDTDVTFFVAPTTNHDILVIRDIAETQDTDYQDTSQFPAEVHERALDKIVAMVQDLKDVVRRALKIRITDTQTTDIPQPVSETLIGWNTGATAIKNWTFVEVLNSLVGTVLLRANNLSDLLSVPTALTNLGIDPFKTTVSASIANNVAVAADITGWTVLGANHRAAVFHFSIKRSTATKESVALGMLFLYRKATGGWALEVGPFNHFNSDVVLDPAGVSFSFSESGGNVQVKYQSHDLTGAGYAGDIKFSGKYFAV